MNAYLARLEAVAVESYRREVARRIAELATLGQVAVVSGYRVCVSRGEVVAVLDPVGHRCVPIRGGYRDSSRRVFAVHVEEHCGEYWVELTVTRRLGLGVAE